MVKLADHFKTENWYPGSFPGGAGEHTAQNGDGDLIGKIVEGDQVAFAELYHRFSSPVLARIFVILRDARDAQDVLQETFVQVWKNRAAYDPARGSVLSWLLTIARSKALDRYRARQRYSRGIAALATELFGQAGDPMVRRKRALEQSERSDRLLLALERIVEKQRAPIVLCFLDGLTQTEVSAALGQPLGTVKARIRRGLLELRQALDAEHTLSPED